MEEGSGRNGARVGTTARGAVLRDHEDGVRGPELMRHVVYPEGPRRLMRRALNPVLPYPFTPRHGQRLSDDKITPVSGVDEADEEARVELANGRARRAPGCLSFGEEGR
jgi:hypothetical protein